MDQAINVKISDSAFLHGAVMLRGASGAGSFANNGAVLDV
jgi:hypothetical protein